MRLWAPLIVLLWLVPVVSLALGPHEIVVIANGDSADSVEIAREYTRMRGVPASNLIELKIPPDAIGKDGGISAAEFSRLIWLRTNRQIQDRAIDDHILAWVYSVDMPTFIRTDPPISIQGLTFLRNRVPEEQEVKAAAYVSLLFADPTSVNVRGHMSQTLDQHEEWLGGDMPLPSMMLGYIGERGNTKAEVLACLRRGLASDGTFPSGTVYFIATGDVRSRCRTWQFEVARRELKNRGVSAAITGRFPSESDGIIGMMHGAQDVAPEQAGTYLPGAIAEHLTSFAGAFHVRSQTKLSSWIAAGAVASAGTVVEPRSIWMKFPHARMFVHYASGCNVIESFFQSIRCPLEILLVGDPLASPWGPKAVLSIQGLDGVVSGRTNIRVKIDGPRDVVFLKCVYLCDGRIVGRGHVDEVFDFDTSSLGDGPHILRTVAYSAGMVRAQVFGERRFVVGGGGKEELGTRSSEWGRKSSELGMGNGDL